MISERSHDVLEPITVRLQASRTDSTPVPCPGKGNEIRIGKIVHVRLHQILEDALLRPKDALELDWTGVVVPKLIGRRCLGGRKTDRVEGGAARAGTVRAEDVQFKGTRRMERVLTRLEEWDETGEKASLRLLLLLWILARWLLLLLPRDCWSSRRVGK